LDSGFGHDKSLTLRPYANLPENERPTMFYAGDGVSDLSAARETDLLFAKKGKGTYSVLACPESLLKFGSTDLVTYCVKEEIPFTVFESWQTIFNKTKDILYVPSHPCFNIRIALTALVSEGKTDVKEAAQEGFKQYKAGEAGIAPP